MSENFKPTGSIRPTRSRNPLSDISNSIGEKFQEIGKRISSVRKRRSSIECPGDNSLDASSFENSRLKENSLNIEKENLDNSIKEKNDTSTICPSTSSSLLDISLKENSTLKAEVIDPMLDAISRNKEAEINKTKKIEQCISPIKRQRLSKEGHDNKEFGAKPKLSEKELEKKIFGFNLPPKINRNLPLITKGITGSQCTEIIDEIYAFYNEDREKYTPKNYFSSSKSSELTGQMRNILIDWLIEIHYKFQLNNETLWLTCNILDRYLEKKILTIKRNMLQLIGITSFFIACKLIESRSPSVKDCVIFTNNTYSNSEIISMEFNILTTLNYKLIVPTSYHYIVRLFNYINNFNVKIKSLCFYIAEKSLQETDILNYSTINFSCAAVFVSIFAMTDDYGRKNYKNLWTKKLEFESGVSLSEFLPCAKILIENNNKPPLETPRRLLDSLKSKYNTNDNHFVSNIIIPEIIEYED